MKQLLISISPDYETIEVAYDGLVCSNYVDVRNYPLIHLPNVRYNPYNATWDDFVRLKGDYTTLIDTVVDEFPTNTELADMIATFLKDNMEYLL